MNITSIAITAIIAGSIVIFFAILGAAGDKNRAHSELMMKMCIESQGSWVPTASGYMCVRK